MSTVKIKLGEFISKELRKEPSRKDRDVSSWTERSQLRSSGIISRGERVLSKGFHSRASGTIRESRAGCVAERRLITTTSEGRFVAKLLSKTKPTAESFARTVILSEKSIKASNAPFLEKYRANTKLK